jgi:hypothetical protein
VKGCPEEDTMTASLWFPDVPGQPHTATRIAVVVAVGVVLVSQILVYAEPRFYAWLAVRRHRQAVTDAALATYLAEHGADDLARRQWTATRGDETIPGSPSVPGRPVAGGSA